MPELVRKAGLLEDETGLHVMPLAVLLLNALGHEYIAWSSEALREELQERFGTIGVVTWERIQALRILQAHDAFWKDWEVFEKVTAAILGEAPIFSLVQPPEAEEIAIALDVASKIDKHDFSAEVKGYIVSACLTDGLWYLEPPLNVVEEDLRAYDDYHHIQRDFAGVAAALQESSTYRPEFEDPISSQVNRVLDVRHALRLYNAEVEKQLKSLPEKVK